MVIEIIGELGNQVIEEIQRIHPDLPSYVGKIKEKQIYRFERPRLLSTKNAKTKKE